MFPLLLVFSNWYGNIQLLMEPGQKRKQMILYFLSNKIFYNDYSFRILMMLQVIFLLLNIIFH